jgi:hypothetical protein
MARKNIPLTILRPGVEELHKIEFLANAAGNENYIPFRYPFADISNYLALRSAGFFRHPLTGGVAAVEETTLGGDATSDQPSNLGYQLPRTEKLVLLCLVNDDLTTDKTITITIKGSEQYDIDDVTYEIGEDSEHAFPVSSGDIFEIDLYNFGLLINDGELLVTADGTADTHGDDDKVSFALIARTA